MLAGLVVREFAGPGAGHRADRGCGRLRWCEQPDPQTRCRRALGGPRGRYGRPAPPTGFRGGLCSGPPRHAGSRRRPTVSSANFNGPPPGWPVLLRKCVRGIGMTGGRRRPLNASRPRSTSPGSHKVRTSSVRAERVDAGGRLAAFDRGSQSARSRWPGLCGFRCPISQDAGRPIPDSGSTFRLGVQAGPISAGRAWGATTGHRCAAACCRGLPVVHRRGHRIGFTHTLPYSSWRRGLESAPGPTKPPAGHTDEPRDRYVKGAVGGIAPNWA